MVTDWFGVAGTAASAAAGVDLEMPGPGLRPPLAAAVRAGEVDEKLVDAQVTRLLSVFDRLGALDGGDPGDDVSTDAPEHRAVARRAATESMVLLANDGLLPLDRAALRTVAIVGPNAPRAQIMGGGSASLRATHLATPVEALTEALGEGVTVVHERGCDNRRNVPVLGGAATAAPGHDRPGLAVDWFANPDLAGEPVHHSHTPSADLVAFEPPGPRPPAGGRCGPTPWSRPPSPGPTRSR